MLKPKFTLKQARRWSVLREDGVIAWVISRGVFGWGTAMFTWMTAWKYFTGGAHAITGSHIITGLVIWPIAGAGFGLTTWYASERAYREYQEKEQNEK